MNSEHRIEYKVPTRIVWCQGTVSNPALLLCKTNEQIVLNATSSCRMQNNGIPASILLDFGKELHGSVQLRVMHTTDNKPVRLRIRLGESVSEAMSELYGKKNATNDHAIRDQIVTVPWMGSFQTSQSGFRFVRIDLIDPNSFFALEGVRALFCYRDIPYRGRFTCSDELLNTIWQTGAYTAHLNMQEYLWDGIKRDRLVWIGDIHPETMTINSVFGYNEVVPKSLDLIRDATALPQWMNDISSYSLWWILIHHCWFYYQGNLEYLNAQKDYLMGLLEMLFDCVDSSGRETLPERRFLDWPSSQNEKAIHAGLHSLLMMAFARSAQLCESLGQLNIAQKCHTYVQRMKTYLPDHNGSKQAGALMAMAGLVDAADINKTLLSVGGCRNMSTFYGYYILQAIAKAGNIKGALNIIKQYWGGMLELGATTFWEDFNIDWKKNAIGIDQIAPEGKKDIHGDYGDYCYKGFRHSLCHGWASGPTAWLSEHVLGVKPVRPGFKKVEIAPSLGELKWAEGAFPTPYGDINIRHENKQGMVKTEVQIPDPINIEMDL